MKALWGNTQIAYPKPFDSGYDYFKLLSRIRKHYGAICLTFPRFRFSLLPFNEKKLALDGLDEVEDMSGKEIYLEVYRRCPNCGKRYTPVLDRKHPEILIQEEFPEAPAWQREQHISGLCSDKCWKEFLGLS